MSESIPEAYALLIKQIENITNALTQDDQISVLTETDILLKTLTPKFTQEHQLDKLQKKINNFLLNHTNYRILRLNQKVKTEIDTAIEYYDKDRGNDHRLFYQKQLEQDLMELNQEIRTFIALLIKNKLSEEFQI
jgi:hypothetical protein